MNKQDWPFLVALCAIFLICLLIWLVPLHAAQFSLADVAATFAAIFTLALALFSLIQLTYTRKSNERQLRAYIQVLSANVADAAQLKIADEITNPFVGGVVTSYLEIKNTGLTPAHKVVHWGELAIVPVGDEDTLIAPVTLADVSAATVGTSHTVNKMRVMASQMTLAELVGIRAGTHAICVYGKIVYQDIFKRTRMTNYRLTWTGSYPPPPVTILQFAQRGNDSD